MNRGWSIKMVVKQLVKNLKLLKKIKAINQQEKQKEINNVKKNLIDELKNEVMQ